MPGRNKTGPMGYGPLTGRGMGPCGGGMAHRGHYIGRHAGSGYGMRCGGFFKGEGNFEPVNLTAEEQKEQLNLRKSFLENKLNDLQKQIDEL